MTPPAAPKRYQPPRCPGERLSQGVWLASRCSLSSWDVQESLGEGGITVAHEAVRQWGLQCGQDDANPRQRRRPRPGETGQ